MMDGATSPECHVFLVWSEAAPYRQRILEDIALRFTIQSVHEVTWPSFDASLSRFYGQNLPKGAFKQEHCGTGPFTVIVVEDPAPRYALRKTSKGMKAVNSNTFDAKTRFRAWTGGGHRIHATDDARETMYNLALLFDVPATLGSRWDGHIVRVERDVTGTDGWRNMQQLFGVLEGCTPYVVLSDSSRHPDRRSCNEQGDVHLLVEDLEAAVWAINGRRLFDAPWPAHYATEVGGETLTFVLGLVGDGCR